MAEQSTNLAGAMIVVNVESLCLGRVAADSAGKAEFGDEFVDRAVSLDAMVRFRNTDPTGKTGLAVISLFSGNRQGKAPKRKAK